jgi:hypothetical protein
MNEQTNEKQIPTDMLTIYYFIIIYITLEFFVPQFMVQSQMSRLRLTKIITVLPYFLVINQSGRRLRYMEENPIADLWLDINKGDVSNVFVCFYIQYFDFSFYVQKILKSCLC